MMFVAASAKGDGTAGALIRVPTGGLACAVRLSPVAGELCGVTGTVATPEMRIDEFAGEARYQVRWS